MSTNRIYFEVESMGGGGIVRISNTYSMTFWILGFPKDDLHDSSVATLLPGFEQHFWIRSCCCYSTKQVDLVFKVGKSFLQIIIKNVTIELVFNLFIQSTVNWVESNSFWCFEFYFSFILFDFFNTKPLY